MLSTSFEAHCLERSGNSMLLIQMMSLVKSCSNIKLCLPRQEESCDYSAARPMQDHRRTGWRGNKGAVMQMGLLGKRSGFWGLQQKQLCCWTDYSCAGELF